MRALVFVHRLIGDLSRASNANPACFHILKISAGSLVVDAEIRADPGGWGPSPEGIAAELQRQARHARSVLRMGSVTCQVESLAVSEAGAAQGSQEPHTHTCIGSTDTTGVVAAPFPGGEVSPHAAAAAAAAAAGADRAAGHSSRRQLEERQKQLDRCEALLASGKQALREENVRWGVE